MTLKDFYTQVQGITRSFSTFILKHDLTNAVQVDHVCYKCGSHERFEHIRSLFENESQYVYQAIISKRRIAYVKLKKGIKTPVGTIQFLELSDQKLDGSQHDSFDHIEVYPKKGTYKAMISNLAKKVSLEEVRRPHHTTHDAEMGEYIFRGTTEPLIEKIKREEL